jgi:hypothetical protein
VDPPVSGCHSLSSLLKNTGKGLLCFLMADNFQEYSLKTGKQHIYNVIKKKKVKTLEFKEGEG